MSTWLNDHSPKLSCNWICSFPFPFRERFSSFFLFIQILSTKDQHKYEFVKPTQTSLNLTSHLNYFASYLNMQILLSTVVWGQKLSHFQLLKKLNQEHESFLSNKLLNYCSVYLHQHFLLLAEKKEIWIKFLCPWFISVMSIQGTRLLLLG